jgi:predicted nucleotidyltransferase
VNVLTAQVARSHHLDANQMAAVHKAKERLLSGFPIESVKLFGSYSRGNATNDSDIDLFVKFFRLIWSTTP